MSWTKSYDLSNINIWEIPDLWRKQRRLQRTRANLTRKIKYAKKVDSGDDKFVVAIVR